MRHPGGTKVDIAGNCFIRSDDGTTAQAEQLGAISIGSIWSAARGCSSGTNLRIIRKHV